LNNTRASKWLVITRGESKSERPGTPFR